MKSQNAVRLIRELDAEINEIESALKAMMDALHSFITTIPGMGLRMGTMILAEIGGFAHFDSSDKPLAFAGMSPPTAAWTLMGLCFAAHFSAVCFSHNPVSLGVDLDVY